MIRAVFMARRPRVFACGLLYHVIVRGNLLELIRYIHLNPVRAGMVRRIKQHGHSEHHVYLKGKPTEIIEPARVLQLLGGIRGYQRFVNEGLRDGHNEEYYAVEKQ